jgi:hypothetical protein
MTDQLMPKDLEPTIVKGQEQGPVGSILTKVVEHRIGQGDAYLKIEEVPRDIY